MLDVFLDYSIVKLPANEPFRIVDSVLRVSGSLVLGRFSDQALCLCKGYERGRRVGTLIVGNYLYLLVEHDGDTRVGSA